MASRTGFSLKLLLLAGAAALPLAACAAIGVGVGVGKINVQEQLHAGSIYQLPSVPVLNTGDEPSDYGMLIEYNETQPQLRPDQSWFVFSPSTFHLDPGKVQTVAVTLSVPIKAVPGDYFAYVEAHPVKKTQVGVATVAVAAAAKLDFTVSPSNFFQGLYYRTVSFIAHYAPWTYVAFGVIAAAALIALFRKYFKFNIGISKKE